MNILHMKYAVEVARLGSLSKAAEALLIAQPNISRSIKELEADLGILIFNRSTKGMVLTPEGERFIGYAKGILKQIEDVELLYRNGAQKKQHFTVCVPRDCRMARAFATFCTEVEPSAEISYKECDAQGALQGVLSNECKLGVIRYAKEYDGEVKAVLAEKEICFEPLASYSPLLLMNAAHPLAKKERITKADLSSFTEIVHTDHFRSVKPFSKAAERAFVDCAERSVLVGERAARLELLCECAGAFLWSAPVPREVTERYGLITRECADDTRTWCDILIFREGYKLTRADKLFVEKLQHTGI